MSQIVVYLTSSASRITKGNLIAEAKKKFGGVVKLTGTKSAANWLLVKDGSDYIFKENK